jgi:hypothetical protein
MPRKYSKEYMQRYVASHREQIRANATRRRKAIRAEQVAALGGCCVKCGAREDLHFDHIDPTTKLDAVTRLLNTRAKLLIEVAKCQLLCASCHNEKNQLPGEQWKQLAKHGGAAMYNKHKCRCELCRAWKQTYDVGWRVKSGRTKQPRVLVG